MAKWISFKRNVDHRHASRAVTAYKAGSTVYVPDHIITKLPADSFEVVERPSGKAADVGDNDGRRVFLND
jgi:hypothetical protein